MIPGVVTLRRVARLFRAVILLVLSPLLVPQDHRSLPHRGLGGFVSGLPKTHPVCHVHKTSSWLLALSMIAAHAVHGKLELPRVVETLSTVYETVVLPLNYGSVLVGSSYTVIVATSVSLSPPCNVTTDGTA